MRKMTKLYTAVNKIDKNYLSLKENILQNTQALNSSTVYICPKKKKTIYGLSFKSIYVQFTFTVL